MDKQVQLSEVLKLVKDGDTIMVGGFMTNGTPERLIDILVTSKIKELTLICNDAGLLNKGVGKLVQAKKFSKIIASHIGLNKEAGRQMNAGETEIELIPQGTLIERIRCGAFGLGGVLTPTGIGTLVEDGKQKIMVDDREYLLEKPLKADVALVFADKSDRMGNLQYSGSENNFNHLMAANAKTTIVETRKIVEKGEIKPEYVHTPGVFVNYLVERCEE